MNYDSSIENQLAMEDINTFLKFVKKGNFKEILKYVEMQPNLVNSIDEVLIQNV
jgi:hypothetical protein